MEKSQWRWRRGERRELQVEVEEMREKRVASGSGGEEREESSNWKWKWRRGESRQQQVEVEEMWRS